MPPLDLHAGWTCLWNGAQWVYTRDTKGTAETVKAFGEADFRRAHARLLTRSNAYVAIVGAIPPERAGRMVDRILAGLPEGAPHEPEFAGNTPPPGVHVVELDVPQSVAIFGHAGLRRDDPDFIAAYDYLMAHESWGLLP